MGENTSKNGKVITAIVAPNIRGIVNMARKLFIQRKDIVTLTKEGNDYILVYYGGEN